MQTDKDDPRTWVKYRESLCRTCWGTCCTMPVEVKFDDLVRLGYAAEDDRENGLKKLVSRLKKRGLIQSYREHNQMFTLTQQANGDCVHLNSKTRLCQVYDRRPDVCRNFPKLGLRPGFCPAQATANRV